MKTVKPVDGESQMTAQLAMFREVTVETITNLMCALEFPTVINKNIVCISGKNGKSTCNVSLSHLIMMRTMNFKGDSGGPLHLVRDGVFKQIGITSFGSSVGCEIGFHAGFTRFDLSNFKRRYY